MNRPFRQVRTLSDAVALARDLLSAWMGRKEPFPVLDDVPPRGTSAAPAPLSPDTERRLAALFSPDARAQATELLTGECGRNLPGCEHSNEVQLEQIRFAALKLSKGDLGRLKATIEQAKVDWRDIVLWAGFAWRAGAYKRWLPKSRFPGS